jgi:hypothetical protein
MPETIQETSSMDLHDNQHWFHSIEPGSTCLPFSNLSLEDDSTAERGRGAKVPADP